jgi:hypothetical protein
MASKLYKTISEIYKKPEREIKEFFDSGEETAPIETKGLSLIKGRTSIFNRASKAIKEFGREHKVDIKYLLLAIPIIVSFFIFKEVQRRQSISTGALTHQASLGFQVESWTLPPESSFDIWVNSDSIVDFSEIEVTFDPNIIKLTGEVYIYPSLTRIIKVTPMSEANATGRISIVLGLDPSQISSPPSGNFRLAKLSINTKSTSYLNTVLGFNNANIHIVSGDQSVFNTTTTGLTLTLNPTPTPTGTPVPTPTAIPTVAPTVAPTPVVTAAPTPAVTSNPTPTPAANTQISGIVTNRSNSAPISNASVKFQRSKAKWWQGSTTVKTDTYGHYGVILPNDTYKITVSKRGYRTMSQNLTLTVNTILNFQLSPR